MSFNVSVSVTIDRGRLERLLRLPNGIVYRNIQRRTERAAEVARRLAPGTMPQFISARMEPGPTGRVISRHPATIYVVSGTRPHLIRPVRARALRFEVGGRVVYAKIVHHPGTTAQPFLQEALRSVL